MDLNGIFYDYGGNKVKQLKSHSDLEHVFSSHPYLYKMVSLKNKKYWKCENLRSFTLFLLHIDKDETIFIPEIEKTFRQGDIVQVENSILELELNNKSVIFLIAGTNDTIQNRTSITVTSHENAKRVTKPWGYELWLTGEHPLYSFKEIRIRSGTKTSLQCHLFKHETNVIFHGNALLYYKLNSSLPNELVKKEDIGFVELTSPTIINISPTVLHRLEAISDVLLYEVSTPHLDDVIRISDDNSRPNGRIQSEHGL